MHLLLTIFCVRYNWKQKKIEKEKTKEYEQKSEKSSHPSITFFSWLAKGNEQKPPGIWCAGDAQLKYM